MMLDITEEEKNYIAAIRQQQQQQKTSIPPLPPKPTQPQIPKDHITKKAAAFEVIRYLMKIRILGIVCISGILVSMLLTQLNFMIGAVIAIVASSYVGYELVQANKMIQYLNNTYNINTQPKQGF